MLVMGPKTGKPSSAALSWKVPGSSGSSTQESAAAVGAESRRGVIGEQYRERAVLPLAAAPDRENTVLVYLSEVGDIDHSAGTRKEGDAINGERDSGGRVQASGRFTF